MKMLDYGRLLYDPNVVVYHHRRPLFTQHLRQIFNVGVHRGFFFKRHPETSRHLLYLIPTTLTLCFWILFFLSFTSPLVLGIFLLSFGFFFGIAMSNVLSITDIPGTIIASIGIITTHMAYGIGFLRGLSVHNLNR